MENKRDYESDSGNEVEDCTIMPKVDLQVSKLEVPVEVQKIISKIEQAQLLRTREVGILRENFIACNLFFR